MTRTVPLDRYRNIGILASLDAGRTTTTERLLAVTAREAAGATAPVAAGLGWIEQDNQRDITLTSAATSCVWRDCRINIVELPSKTKQPLSGPLNVLDGAIVMVDAVTGVTPEVETALAAAEARGIATLVFVNKLDREEADIAPILAALAARGKATVLPLQLPIGAGAGLKGLVDLVGGTATLWHDRAIDAPGEDGAIPADLAAEAAAGRANLASLLGVDGGDNAALAQQIRASVRVGSALPVLYGSAFRNRGIRRLLDAIVAYLPAPSELALHAVAADGQAINRQASDDEPFTGLAFQTVDDPSTGRLTFVRIYSGVVATGSPMLNSASASPERIGVMVRMFANHTEEIGEARAGDIVALAGLNNTTTGDTLCDPAVPVTLERVPASAGRAKH